MKRCPKDDFTLAPQDYDGVEIDICPHCGGAWLDDGELEAIQAAPGLDGKSPTPAMFAPAPLSAALPEATYNCVTCSSQLVKRDYGFGSGVQIDNCPKGHGMWLDASELQKLELFYEGEQSHANAREAEILAALKKDGKGGFLKGLMRFIARNLNAAI